MPVLPEDVPYTNGDWDEETFALFAEGRDPPACPRCGRTGFYGPRVSDRLGRHRACRFCGLFQKVDGPVEQSTAARHDCTDWPAVARAPYVWWLEPGQNEFTCPFCGDTVTSRDGAMTPPVDDESHAWWKVPQQRTRFYYARLWENWPFTKGRVFL